MGEPHKQRSEMFIWETTDGSISFQTTQTTEGFEINLFLTSHAIRNFTQLRWAWETLTAALAGAVKARLVKSAALFRNRLLGISVVAVPLVNGWSRFIVELLWKSFDAMNGEHVLPQVTKRFFLGLATAQKIAI